MRKTAVLIRASLLSHRAGAEQARRFWRPQTPPVYPTFGGTVAAEVGEYGGGDGRRQDALEKTMILEDAWFDRMF